MGMATVIVGFFALAIAAEAHAQSWSSDAVVDQLTRWTMEDIARQRARAHAEEIARKPEEPLDLSEYGTLAAEQQPSPTKRKTQRYRQPPPSGLDCVTVDLSDEMRATHCF